VAAVDVGPGCDTPTEGFGTSQGELFDPSVTLKDCDGNQVTLAELMCGKELTLIDIGAGWCEPCQEQAETLDEEIYEPFRDKGVQVISILFENGQHLPANVEFCKQWKGTYGLTSPVLVDPTFRLKPFFTNVSSSTPVILLVDDTFTIVYQRSGEAPKDLVQTIEAELAK
jgi:thiol-disulfide isomerase/thioredoxin